MSEIPLDLIGAITGIMGAITGGISLIWLILNSRSKVILERVYFTRESSHNRKEKEVIKYEFTIRNKGNRSTTIEDIWLKIGNRNIPYQFHTPEIIKANSSWKHSSFIDFTPKEFKELLEYGRVKMGITIIHTFGKLRREGWTDFKSDWLSI